MNVIEIRELISTIDLPRGEVVAAATTFHDYIIVVTDRGTIFEIWMGE